MLQITATHQLETAIGTLALAARPILLASTSGNLNASLSGEMKASLLMCKTSLVNAMFSTLLGLDANDPPKTLATLQLYCSVLSSVSFLRYGLNWWHFYLKGSNESSWSSWWIWSLLILMFVHGSCLKKPAAMITCVISEIILTCDPMLWYCWPTSQLEIFDKCRRLSVRASV